MTILKCYILVVWDWKGQIIRWNKEKANEISYAAIITLTVSAISRVEGDSVHKQLLDHQTQGYYVIPCYSSRKHVFLRLINQYRNFTNLYYYSDVLFSSYRDVTLKFEMSAPQIQIKSPEKQDQALYVNKCIFRHLRPLTLCPCTKKGKAGRLLWVQGQPEWQSEFFEVRLGHRVMNPVWKSVFTYGVVMVPTQGYPTTHSLLNTNESTTVRHAEGARKTGCLWIA